MMIMKIFDLIKIGCVAIKYIYISINVD